MLQKIDSELIGRVREDVFRSLIQNDKRGLKCIGVLSPDPLINENGKRVGKIVFIHYSETVSMNKRKKSLSLGLFVQFKEEKGFEIHKEAGVMSGIWVIPPHFVTPYSPDPKLKVPVLVMNHKDESFSYEFLNLTYKQFQERRLEEYFFKEKWQYRWVKAYHNFRHLYATSGQKYYGINSTVKHCWIKQNVLEKILSDVDNRKRVFKGEWLNLMNQHIRNNHATEAIDKLYKKHSKESEKTNVIPLSSIK